jgi:hypothetical protein
MSVNVTVKRVHQLSEIPLVMSSLSEEIVDLILFAATVLEVKIYLNIKVTTT